MPESGSDPSPSSPLPRRRVLLSGAALGAALGAAARVSGQSRGEELLELTTFETATIDGRSWDEPIVGGRTVDAVHRSVLVRFPEAAEAIADSLGKGQRLLVKAELVLFYDGYEIVPLELHLPRSAWAASCGPRIRRAGTSRPGRCVSRGSPTRPAVRPSMPASMAAVTGPATAPPAPTRDRHAGLLEPQELSTAGAQGAPRHHAAAGDRRAGEGRRRAPALLWSSAASCCARSRPTTRAIAQLGDAYEWAMPTGGHGLRFASPRIVLTSPSVSRRRHGGRRPAAGARSRRRCLDRPTSRGRPPSCRRREKLVERARTAIASTATRAGKAGRSNASASCSAWAAIG